VYWFAGAECRFCGEQIREDADSNVCEDCQSRIDERVERVVRTVRELFKAELVEVLDNY
jgi:hypothetical protein